jgi:S1-C subfamily serine protease
VPEGPVQLTIEASDLPIVEVERSVVQQARLDRAYDLGEVDLPDAGSVSGSVVDARGDPVVGAQVSTTPISGYSPVAALPKGTVVSDQFGRFRLMRVAVGKVVLRAFAPGVGRGVSEAVELLSGHDREDVRIKLDQPVVDESPAAATSGVSVSLGQSGSNIVVELVAPASEAERAGIRPGDHVIAIDGVKLRDAPDARARLSGRENSDVLLELERQGQSLRLRTVREIVRR